MLLLWDLKEKGSRFEIACYKNKVISWRSGVEKNLDEVLQVERIFTNVSKGIVASSKDLLDAFDTDDVKEICQIILKKGDLQVSSKERNHQLEETFKEIATIVADKCINSETKKPFPVSMIEQAMKEIHFSIKPNKSAKQQAISLVKELQASKLLPIQRAQMRLRIDIPNNIGKKIKSLLEPHVISFDKELFGLRYQLVTLIDPGQYRNVDGIVQANTKGQGTVEVLEMAVQELGDEELL